MPIADIAPSYSITSSATLVFEAYWRRTDFHMAELRSRYWSAWSLSIGTIKLADGRGVKGFLVEATATIGARDISSFGGWRAFLAREQIPAWIRVMRAP